MENKEQNHTVKKTHNYCDYCEKKGNWFPSLWLSHMKMNAKIYLEDSQHICNGGYEERKKEDRKKGRAERFTYCFAGGDSVVKSLSF